MTKTRIFLDDERMPPDDGKEWVIARTFAEFANIVKEVADGERPLIDFISFDHDIMDIVDGKACANYLVETDMSTWVLTEDFTFYVHSQNPPGAENIRLYLEDYLKNVRS